MPAPAAPSSRSPEGHLRCRYEHERRSRRGGDDPVVRDPEVPRTDLLLTASIHGAPSTALAKAGVNRRRRPRCGSSRSGPQTPRRACALVRPSAPGNPRSASPSRVRAAPDCRVAGALLPACRPRSPPSSCVSRTLCDERHQKARCSYRFAALDTCNRTPRLLPSSCGTFGRGRTHAVEADTTNDPGLHANHVNVMRLRRPRGRRGRRVRRFLIGSTDGGRVLTLVIEQTLGPQDVVDRDRLERNRGRA
jgi:hypothetical protein